jgi:superfamily I DNA/RNA helicase
LQDLNAAQRQAVTVEEPVLVLAGPGSGKTRVLTTLLPRAQYRCHWQIMAVVSNKAAGR